MTDATFEAFALPRRLGLAEQIDWDRWLMTGLLLIGCLWMLAVVIFPLGVLFSKSVFDSQGAFIGLANFQRYFHTPSLARSLTNSLFVSVVTTLVSVPLGLAYAYALTRSCIPGKGFFRGIALLPLFAPTLLYGIFLVYLFGKKGLITTGLFGFWERTLGVSLAVDIGLYGPVGIIISEILFTFPQAMLILAVALSLADARLYEAAASLRASQLRTFFTVTLPGIKYGLISAVFVCFISAFTDFGAPKVVGGNYNVLATDIYKQVIGQQDFGMGATVSIILLVPTVLAFLLDRFCQRRQTAAIAAKAVPYRPQPTAGRDGVLLAFCSAIAVGMIVLFSTALFASLVKVWPYNLGMDLSHYNFRNTGGGGLTAFWNSVRMSAYTALAGTAVTFLGAYLIEKVPGARGLRQAGYFLATIPLALPGLVIGLSYIFFFNAPAWQVLGWRVPNPFHVLYGTMAILVLCNIVHFSTVSFLTATTALKQLDREFESVSQSMSVPFYVTLTRVTIPVCLPAILEIALYFFVNAMATVSGVIFLYSADLQLASVAVANMDDAGDVASAAAMSVLIVAANILVRYGYGVLTKGFRTRAQAWLAA